MTVRIWLVDEHSSQGHQEVLREPNKCPICNKSIIPVKCYAYKSSDNRSSLEVVYRCPGCDRLFLAFYSDPQYGNRPPGVSPFLLSDTGAPFVTELKEFSEIINSISEQFQKIFCQAMIAEKNGLGEICGPGYGKALEFLVKDYLVHLHPKREEEIKKMWLGEAVKSIDDKNVKICAERAA